MEVRYIENKDFISLVDIFTELQAPLHDKKKEDFYSFACSALCEQMKLPDFVAIGLFDGDKLEGFVLGHGVNKNVFHFSAIYVRIKNSRKLKDLVDVSIKHAESLNYKKWEADCINKNIVSILTKWGAETEFTRLAKEIKNG